MTDISARHTELILRDIREWNRRYIEAATKWNKEAKIIHENWLNYLAQQEEEKEKIEQKEESFDLGFIAFYDRKGNLLKFPLRPEFYTRKSV